MTESASTNSHQPDNSISIRQRLTEVAFYCDFLKILSDRAKSYQATFPRGQRPSRNLIVGDLEELYSSTRNSDTVASSAQLEPNRARTYREILDELSPRIEGARLLTDPAKLNSREIIKKVASTMTSASWEQRARILTIAGYSSEEVQTAMIVLGKTAALSVFLGWSSDGVAAVSATYFHINQVLNPEWTLRSPDFTDFTTMSAIVGSQVLWWSSVLVNAGINAKMMQSRIRACPSFLGTATGLVAQKFLPENKSAQDRLVIAASMASDTLKEAAVFFGPMLISGNALIGANLGGSLAGYIQALGAGLYFYKSRRSSKETKS